MAEAVTPDSTTKSHGVNKTRKPLVSGRPSERKPLLTSTPVQAVLPLEAPPELPRVICRVGSHVVVRSPEGDEFEVQVVPAGKGDISRGTISADSPVGRAVLGKTAGTVARVILPDGPADYLVVDVRDIDD